MSHSQVVKLLRDLGFCNESATLYVHLLDEAPLSLTDLTRKAGVAEEQAIPLLGKLIASRLVFEDRGHYWVLNPRKAFKAFADDVLWSVTSTISDGLDDVPEDQLDYVRTVREVCRRLQNIASQLYTHRSPIAVGRIKVARDSDHLAALLAEAIDTAKEEILCASTSPRQPQLSVIWGSLLARINDGVRYVRIVDIAEVIEHGFTIVQRDVEAGIELYIIERDRINRKFYVIDDRYVVMFTPEAYDFTLTGQVISNKLIIGNYRKAFDALLEYAIPASFVLELMAKRGSDLLTQATQKMNESEVRWLECLIEFGIYCKFREFDALQLASAVERATEEKLIEVREADNGTVVLLPKYSWSVDEIRRLWSIRQRNQSHKS